jgi:hypothetical protein
MSRRAKYTVTVVLVVAVGCFLGWLVPAVKHAKQAARRCAAHGRLCQMRLALENYERSNGTLPPICLKDDQGKPLQSWRALILPHLELESLKRLDLSQSWDSKANREIIAAVPQNDWMWFARDVTPPERGCIVTQLVALIGKDSVWDAKTGLPKKQRDPHDIWIISIPESDIHPLEPRDVTEEELRARVDRGEEVFFINGERSGYGTVRIKDGKLMFDTHSEDPWPDDLTRSVTSTSRYQRSLRPASRRAGAGPLGRAR